MDDKRFDQLTRMFSSGASRRTLLRGLLGLGGLALVSDEADARTARSRPTIPPPPPATTPAPTTTTTAPCQGQEQCPNSTLCCPIGTCARSGNQAICCDGSNGNGAVVCGLECCDSPYECCDGECCASGHICLTTVFAEGPNVEEEMCCPAHLACDNQCCDGSCYFPFSGAVWEDGYGFVVNGHPVSIAQATCCPAGGTLCFVGDGGNLCCSDSTPKCCPFVGETSGACRAEGACCDAADCATANPGTDSQCWTCDQGTCVPVPNDTACGSSGQFCCEQVCCDAGTICGTPDNGQSAPAIEAPTCCVPLGCLDDQNDLRCGESDGCGGTIECVCKDDGGVPVRCCPIPGSSNGQVCQDVECCDSDDCDDRPCYNHTCCQPQSCLVDGELQCDQSDGCGGTFVCTCKPDDSDTSVCCSSTNNPNGAICQDVECCDDSNCTFGICCDGRCLTATCCSQGSCLGPNDELRCGEPDGCGGTFQCICDEVDPGEFAICCLDPGNPNSRICRDCPAGHVCDANEACAPPTTTTTTPAPVPCQSNDDCTEQFHVCCDGFCEYNFVCACKDCVAAGDCSSTPGCCDIDADCGPPESCKKKFCNQHICVAITDCREPLGDERCCNVGTFCNENGACEQDMSCDPPCTGDFFVCCEGACMENFRCNCKDCIAAGDCSGTPGCCDVVEDCGPPESCKKKFCNQHICVTITDCREPLGDEDCCSGGLVCNQSTGSCVQATIGSELNAESLCEPVTTCAPDQCGPVDDGCGNTIHCGDCPTTPAPCVSGTCASLGGGCGQSIDDGCGTLIYCGDCPTTPALDAALALGERCDDDSQCGAGLLCRDRRCGNRGRHTCRDDCAA